MSRFLRLILIFALASACAPTATPVAFNEAVTAIPQPPDLPTATPTDVVVMELPTSIALPAGPVTMVALGDSLTQGDGDDSGRGYPGRLLDMVNKLRPASTMTNLGQSGWSSDALINGDQGVDGQLSRAVTKLKSAADQGQAAVALVWIGSNDLWYLYEYGEGSDENDAQDAQRFTSNIDLIISSLRGTGAAVFVALLDDQSKRPVALLRQAFTGITPDELARMSQQVLRYNQIISTEAAQYGTVSVDFYNADIFTLPKTLADDGNHPNPAGYDLIAQKWFEALQPLLITP